MLESKIFRYKVSSLSFIEYFHLHYTSKQSAAMLQEQRNSQCSLMTFLIRHGNKYDTVAAGRRIKSPNLSRTEH